MITFIDFPDEVWINIISYMSVKDKIMYLMVSPRFRYIVLLTIATDFEKRHTFIWRLIEDEPKHALFALLMIKRRFPNWWSDLIIPEDVRTTERKRVTPRDGGPKRIVNFIKRKPYTGKLAPVIHKLGNAAGEATPIIAKLLGFAGQPECPMLVRRWSIAYMTPRDITLLLQHPAPPSTATPNIIQLWTEIVMRALEITREENKPDASYIMISVLRCKHLPFAARDNCRRVAAKTNHPLLEIITQYTQQKSR